MAEEESLGGEATSLCLQVNQEFEDQNYWQKVESYITKHSKAQFSHSFCHDCYTAVVQPQLDGKRSSKVTG
jgi:hypothetical protein